MILPLYVSVPKALRRFKLLSLPKTLLSTLTVFLGARKSKSQRNTIFTFSISEDYARVWHHFAVKNLPEGEWNIVIVDCAGDMDKTRFAGAEVVTFANLAHGAKIDVFLKKYLRSEIVFLCDDDKYILSDLSAAVHELDDPHVAAVSLAPRDWYTLRINGQDFLPMGSYALLLKRELFLKHRLSFKNVPQEFKNRVVAPGVKRPFGYDCGDYANEKLLELGYTIVTGRYRDCVLGFDGLSAPRIFLMRYGKQFALESLVAAAHFKKGSLNGVMARTLYGIVKFEELYRRMFQKDPTFVSGLTTADLRAVIRDPEVLASYDETEQVYSRLEKLTM